MQENRFYDYSKDITVARKAESMIKDLLVEKYEYEFVEFCYDNKYDLLMKNKQGDPISFEIKEEFTHAKTGNIGLEFSCRGKPSGISTSTADYYIIIVHNSDESKTIYKIATSTIKFLVDNLMYFRIVNGGDRKSNSLNYLFRDNLFLSFAEKLYEYN